MHAQLLLFAPFVVLLLMAAGWDLTSYTIPNWISAALLLAFAPFALSALPPAAWGWHALACAIGLAIGFTMFALGWIGGGDAKLFAAASLWFGLHDLLAYALMASVFGGALTLALISMRRFPLPAAMAAQGWIARLHEERGGIPYGAALAAGAVAVLPYSALFHSFAG